MYNKLNATNIFHDEIFWYIDQSADIFDVTIFWSMKPGFSHTNMHHNVLRLPNPALLDANGRIPMNVYDKKCLSITFGHVIVF